MLRPSALIVAFVLAGSVAACKREPTIDCRRTCGCRDHGMCLERGGTCVAGSDQDCKRAAMCAELGRCTLEGDRCVVASDADCESSEPCKKLGRCRATQAATMRVCGK